MAPDRVLYQSPAGLALFDAFPISEGHTLVIPRRHICSIYELTPAEQSDLWTLVAQVRQALIDRYDIESFNIGVNDGIAAGQTIPHAHIHVIPRRVDDELDPRGGVRWIIAEKAAYWK